MTCSLKCESKINTQVLTFQIVEKGRSLLGCKDCKKNNSEAKTSDELKCDIFNKYSDCFEGLGSISTLSHIKIDKEAVPVVHPPRKVPATLRD